MRFGRVLAATLGVAALGVGLGPTVVPDVLGSHDPGALPLGAVTLLAAAASLLWWRNDEAGELP